MMSFAVFLFILICFIPALAAAHKKYFIIIPNRRYDTFFWRFVIAFPFLTFFSFLFSFFWVPAIEKSPAVTHVFGDYGILIPAVVINLFFVFFLRYAVFKNEIPFEFQDDFEAYDFYLFVPPFEVEDDYVFRSISDLDAYYEGHIEVTVDLSKLSGKSFVMTRHGELIARQDVLTLFHENDLSGFTAINIRDTKSGVFSSDHFLIIADNIFVPFSDIKYKKTFRVGGSRERIVFDGKIFCRSSVLNQLSDFNRSSYSLGSRAAMDYSPQKFWILSKKTVMVLINEIGQPKRNFRPVYLDDDG